MRAERAVKALLDGASGVTAIVGAGGAARIYGAAAPQEAAAPLIVYSLQSAEREPVPLRQEGRQEAGDAEIDQRIRWEADRDHER